MSCTDPLLMYSRGIKENGKLDLKFVPHHMIQEHDYFYIKRFYGDSLLEVPCGKCDSCLMKRRKEWSVRCEKEALYHGENCVVTLTYDDEHLPKPSDYKKEFQKFIKSLVNSGIHCRYFGCGELGEITKRFHMHIILFGYRPHDLVFLFDTKKGSRQYRSDFLDKLWNKGHVMVGDFSPCSASYIAGYCDKKYKHKDNFILMSKKPGLGEQYFVSEIRKLLETGNVVLKSGSTTLLPRYFYKLCDKLGFNYDQIKDKQKFIGEICQSENMRKYHFNHREQLLNLNSRMMEEKLKLKGGRVL